MNFFQTYTCQISAYRPTELTHRVKFVSLYIIMTTTKTESMMLILMMMMTLMIMVMVMIFKV